MTDAGLAAIDWTPPKKRVEELPPKYAREIKKDKLAWKNLNALPRGERLLYIRWICEAKQEETRLRRLRLAVEKLRRGDRPSL